MLINIKRWWAEKKEGLGVQCVLSKIINAEDDSRTAIVHYLLWLDRISNNKLVKKKDNFISFFLFFFFSCSSFEPIFVIELNGKSGH